MQVKKDPFYEPVERLKRRRGEVLDSWGPVTLDAVTVSRFHEALCWPEQMPPGSPPPAVLMQLGNIEVDLTKDARPHKSLAPGLTNSVNGGTKMTWARPLVAGEAISGRVCLKDAYAREGKSGPLAMVVVETIFVDGAGKVAARTEKTTIFRGLAP